MFQFLTRKSKGWSLAVATLVVAFATLFSGTARAETTSWDGGGVPFTATLAPDEYTTITLFLPPAAILDLDAAIRMRAQDISGLSIALENTFIDESSNRNTVGIWLTRGAGCAGLGYPPETIKDEDISLYFDDSAQARVDLACDRTIPSLSGRVLTTNATYPPKNRFRLSAFNGRQAGFGTWDVIFHNFDPINSKTITVDDICLIVNNSIVATNTREGDVSPRQYALSIGEQGNSGNLILTISDYIDSALFLLGFNNVDNRIADHSEASPLPDDLSTIADLPLRMSLIEGTADEYTRLDDAPASSGGNGSLTVADWVQTTRYAAGDGFDAPVTSSGPISQYDRILRIGKRNETTLIRRGISEVAIPIMLHSKGIEREIAFGLQFDSNLLEFVRADRGSALPSNAIFQLNNQIGGLPDTIGLQVALLPGMTFPTTIDGTTPTDFAQNIDADLEIAKFYFRAKPGSGAAATELKFLPNPQGFPAPGVRDRAGELQSTSFVTGEVTIINNRDPRPIVRVQDTVINSGGSGIVSVYLDAIGIENSAGFTVNFNPAQLTLTKIERGRDLPLSSFFFTGPDYVIDVSSANTDGQVRVLAGLQPGLAFANGSSNEILKLSFDAIVTATTIDDSAITLTELRDTKEVTDVKAVPLVTDFLDGTVRISQDSCAYTLSSSSRNFTPLGTTQLANLPSFDVSTNSADCPWVASPDVDWVTVLTLGVQNGTQTVVYSVDANSTPDSRVGHILIAGQVFTINQSGCVYTLTPDTQIFAQDGGDGTFQVVTDGSCAWEAISQANWIQITSDEFGQGIDTVSYHVLPLVGNTRTGTIDVSGSTFTVVQNRCSYTIDPTESEVLPPAGAAGNTVDLTTDSDCPWFVSTTSNWIQIQSAISGVGDTTVVYDVTANAGPQRVGFIRIGDQNFRVTQDGTDSCSFEIDVTDVSFSGSGGDGGFTLTATAGCPWTAESDSDWLVITSAGADATAPFQGNGSAFIAYTVQSNSGIARVGNITVGDQTHTVRQFGSNEFAFEFPQDPEGWTFSGPIPPFSAPTGVWSAGSLAQPGRLDLIAADSTNTFGFWGSPVLGLVTPAVLDGLYEADFRVSTDSAPAQVPTFRLRTSPTDFSQTDAFVVTSNLNGNLSPTSAGKDYKHYFTLPPGSLAFRAFFDILNFDPNDAANGRVSLESITLAPVTSGRLTNSTFVRQYLLADSTTGWTIATAPPYAVPVFTKDVRGLKIGSSFNGAGQPPTTVGIWYLNSDIALTANKLYKVAFTVSSRAEGSVVLRKDLVPAFRLRVNDSSFKLSASVGVDSISEDSRVPTFNEKQTYSVWFQSPTEVTGSNLILAFDYLLTPESGNDPRISLILESALVTSFDIADP